MRAILVFVCFTALAFAGCGSDDNPGGNGGNAGSGGTAGSGGSAGSDGGAGSGGSGNVSGNDACQRICESPCAGEVLTPSEIEECATDCQTSGSFLDQCQQETVALLDCLERSDCVGSFECLDEAQAFGTCFDFTF